MLSSCLRMARTVITVRSAPSSSLRTCSTIAAFEGSPVCHRNTDHYPRVSIEASEGQMMVSHLRSRALRAVPPPEQPNPPRTQTPIHHCQRTHHTWILQPQAPRASSSSSATRRFLSRLVVRTSSSSPAVAAAGSVVSGSAQPYSPRHNHS